MTKEELINKIWDCYIDIHNSCGMITDEEAMQKSSKLLDEYELSKLHQPTVISQRELLLDFAEYSENDKKSEHLDELVDNYLDSIKQ